MCYVLLRGKEKKLVEEYYLLNLVILNVIKEDTIFTIQRNVYLPLLHKIYLRNAIIFHSYIIVFKEHLALTYSKSQQLCVLMWVIILNMFENLVVEMNANCVHVDNYIYITDNSLRVHILHDCFSAYVTQSRLK